MRANLVLMLYDMKIHEELQNTTSDSNIISVLDNLIAKASLSVLDPNNSDLKALEKRILMPDSLNYQYFR